MAEQKNILNTTILHEDFTLSTDQPIQQLEKIVKYVEGKMNEIYTRLPLASYKKIAVLAALNIAEELFLARDELENGGGSEAVERADKILRKLEML